MKSVLISIQPYWVFLIIAKTMGWSIDKEKTVEVRKNYPKSNDWNKVVKIYCSKDKKSFAQIPKEYQPLMEKFLGKVTGEFVCDKIFEIEYQCGSYRCKGLTVLENDRVASASKLSLRDIRNYLSCNNGYGWHISNLVIYDKPRELSDFYAKCNKFDLDKKEIYEAHCTDCGNEHGIAPCEYINKKWCVPITRPPQSWCYVESEVEGE